MIAKSLLGTTLTSSIDTHSRLKGLQEHFGMTDDIVSRLAISYSLNQGPVEDEWEVAPYEGIHKIVTGKSIRGKTMFKEDLALWLVLMAIHEPEIADDQIRMKFIQHWERGVQLLASNLEHADWIETIHELVQ
ncbi:MAG: DndE family protein [Candidatus Poseidoniaceae archaeon]